MESQKQLILRASIKSADLQLVKGVSEGKTLTEIAKDMNRGRRTLEARLLRLRKQLECRNTVQLVALFVRNNLID